MHMPDTENRTGRKILFTDVDETLVTSDKKLTDGNRRAIDSFLDAGNIFAISTGRALSGAGNLARDLGYYGRKNVYICAFNGGQIFDTYSEKTLFRRALTQDQVHTINLSAKKYGIHLQAYSDTEVLTETENDSLRRYCAIQNLPFRIVPDLAEAAGSSSCKLLAIDFSDSSRVSGFRDYLEGVPGGADGISFFYSNEWMLEFVPAGISKGYALRFLADYLGVKIENTISAGDAENDIPMIEAAGTGCAMANGSDAIRKCADYITACDNNHDGIAEIIRMFG